MRSPAPEILAKKCDEWGQNWRHRHGENPNASFTWHKVNGEPLNQVLLPELKKQTQDHCSFCDNFPIAPASLETIEHFKPKSRFHLDAYRWSNLYFCCDGCQNDKGNDFDELLLRPDDDDYSFNRFFIWDYATGKIEINPGASEGDKRRAEITIRFYGLNDDHPRVRLRAQKIRMKDLNCEPVCPLDEHPYRDFIQ